ncbi:Uncharacterised protein [uncultured archaeon]|nr:Uncharacterised protein [uncultured archaeon]
MAGATAQKPAPSMPAAKPVAASQEEFNALKGSLNVTSWEMTPNNWDAIQIIYPKKGSEEQARAYLKAIELPTPEM